MTKTIMVQGTMSSAGKSLLVTGLCRLFKQDGYRVAPFKSQNMSSIAHTLDGGLQMSLAQALQAEAAGLAPEAAMNPLLLKPQSDVGSELVVMGESRGTMSVSDYFAHKTSLIPVILQAFESLAHKSDIVVIEGAGSPAEINLRENDIVNMGLASMLDAPVLLVGDIDCGGVFAQLVGTLALLEEDERARVKGTIINKFRGDRTILQPGLALLEEKTQKPVMGVLPYLSVDIAEEDSLVRGVAKPHDKQEYESAAYREQQYELLAAALREHLDVAGIYRILEEQ